MKLLEDFYNQPSLVGFTAQLNKKLRECFRTYLVYIPWNEKLNINSSLWLSNYEN